MSIRKTGGRAGVAAMAALLLAACDGGQDGWRSYKEVYIAPPPREMPAHAMHGAMSGDGGGASALQWKAPEGWSESAGSGMRLATFTMGEGSSTGTCTIITLGGSAGGIEANVTRWVGQTGSAALEDDALKAFIGRQQTIKSEGGFDIFVADLTELAPGDDAMSMLASISTIDGSSCFVKLTGPVSLLKDQKQNFLALCKSLKK